MSRKKGIAKMNKTGLVYPNEVKVLVLQQAPFNRAKSALTYAQEYGIIGIMSDVDSGNKGIVSISHRSIGKMLSGSAVLKSVTPAIHYSALMRLRDIIRESFIAEIHPDYKKGSDGVRRKENGVNPFVDILVLYGAVSMADIVYRSKTTLKRFRDPNAKDNQPNKAYAYEINNIEILTGKCRTSVRPNIKTSTIDTNILLQGVRDVNGELLI